MPDIWTHLIVGDRVLKSLSDPEWGEQINKQRRMFDLGCQGPDFYFYYNFWPWQKDKRAVAIGEAIHHERCGAFYRKMFTLIKSQADARAVPVTVYALGMLCHWSLDRNTHPYIHYISGLYDPQDPASSHLAGNHKRIEAAIDTILLQEYWGLHADQVPANARFDQGPYLGECLVELYDHLARELYPEIWRQQPAGCVQKSYQDMMAACRLFYDPSGRKKKFFGTLDRLTADRFHALCYFYLPEVNSQADYLNRQHRLWCHPADEEECSTASFDDLMDRAVDDATQMIEATLTYLRGTMNEDEWTTTLGNLSFSTGKDCDLPVKLRHTRPILT